MSDEPSEHEQWAMIFNEFGEGTLRSMLMNAAEAKQQNDGRIIIEFDGDRAMDITEHVDSLETDNMENR
jgi:hypothetical protein